MIDPRGSDYNSYFKYVESSLLLFSEVVRRRIVKSVAFKARAYELLETLIHALPISDHICDPSRNNACHRFRSSASASPTPIVFRHPSLFHEVMWGPSEILPLASCKDISHSASLEPFSTASLA